MILILRYSSYSRDTIAEHDRVLIDRGYVWWGWWKKRHEPWPGQLSPSLDTPCEVGLVDRSAGEYYSAICDEAVSGGGDSLDSPDIEATPQYYSADSHPLWLKLTTIKKITRQQWEGRFGGTPREDETLYLRDSPEGSELGSAVEVLSAEAPEGRTGVLHISDLHFGSDHAYSREGKIERLSLIDQLCSALPESPAVVIVSGDLTTKGERDGLTAARLFLEGLADRVGLESKHFVVVPGNHDILVDDEASVKTMANEQNYRDFVQLFYGRDLDLERVHEILLSSGQRLLFGTSNSSKYRANVFMDYGYVGWDRIEPVMAKIQRLSDGGDAHSFYVLHHHLQSAYGNEEPSPVRPVSVTLDAGDLVSLAATYGIGAVAHGHQHLPFIGRLAHVNRLGSIPSSAPSVGLECRQVLTLGAGSLSVQVSRLGDEMRQNSFSFYNTSDMGTRVRVYQFTPTLQPSVLWDFVAPNA